MGPLLAALPLPPRFYGITFLKPAYNSYGALMQGTSSQFCLYCGGRTAVIQMNTILAVEHVGRCHRMMLDERRGT